MDRQSQFALPSLRAARIHRGFSQTRLATLAGMAPSDLCNIESGRRAVGALRRMRLAIVLAMPESLLFGSKEIEAATPQVAE